MQIKSALFGYGVIGKQTAKHFKFAVIVGWDKAKKEFKFLKGSLTKLKNCGEVWICVPTPADKHGRCDTKEVFHVAEFVKSLKINPVLVVRSTVIPSTAKKLQKMGFEVISYPEFLRQKYAKKDMANPWAVVLGCPLNLKDWLKSEFLPRHKYFETHKDKLFLMTPNATAEIAKYASNALFAVLVVFANQVYDVCEKTKADYLWISEFLRALPWREHCHLSIWHDGYRGYKGHCLPKDIKAFTKEFNLPLLRAVEKINAKYLLNSDSNL